MDHANSQNQIIIYDDRIDVRFEGETVWLSQAQLVDLFQSSKANISEHIKNIFAEGELVQEATVRKFRTVQKEGNREVSRDIEHYNLDLIISLGYRVRSLVATKFRIWATHETFLRAIQEQKIILIKNIPNIFFLLNYIIWDGFYIWKVQRDCRFIHNFF